MVIETKSVSKNCVAICREGILALLASSPGVAGGKGNLVRVPLMNEQFLTFKENSVAGDKPETMEPSSIL